MGGEQCVEPGGNAQNMQGYSTIAICVPHHHLRRNHDDEDCYGSINNDKIDEYLLELETIEKVNDCPF